MSDVRHEYVDGAIYAMVGGTERHNQIALTLASMLRTHLHGKPCRVFISDMKVRVGTVFYYPDVMVACGKADPTGLYQTDPTLLIEVLSDSTESKDRLEKLVAYQKIQSLQEYALISQDKVRLDLYRRENTEWLIETFSYGDVVTFQSVDYTVPVEQLYEDVLGSVR